MALLDAAARALFWAAVLAVCAGVGTALAGRAPRKAADLLWDATAGLALLTGVLLTLGMIPGAFRPLPLAAALGAAAVGAVLLFRRHGRRPARPGGAELSVLAVLALVAVAGLVWNRAPTVFFDALAYHLAQPALWLVDGRAAPVSWSAYSWFPPGMSVLYGTGLALGGQPLAQDANLLAGLLLLALSADLAARAWGPWAAPWAAALVACVPLVVHALGIPGADLAHGTFVLGALGAWWAGAREPEHAPAWRRRSAWLAAGACLTKYLGLLVPLAAGAALWSWRERRPRAALAFALPSALLLAPWLAANLHVTGNPVAPAAATLWPVPALAEGAPAQLRADMRGGLPDLADLRALGPRLLSGAPAEDGIYPTPAWGFGVPLLLGAAVLSARTDRSTRILLALAGLCLLVWVVTFRWERFLVAPSALLAVTGAGALVRWRALPLPARALAALGVAASLLGGALAAGAVLRFTGGAGVVLGHEEPEAFLARSLPIVRLYEEAAARLDPRTDRVLLLGETRHFGLNLPHAAPSVYNDHPVAALLAAGRPPQQVVGELRALGFTHLLVDLPWVVRSAATLPSLAPLRGRGPALAALLESLGPPLVSQPGGRLLYALPPQPEASAPQ